ncbi:protease [Dissoconium aciculare CBS 342.82]|uniref:Protease n=1 Tax=Dissoconium aciculare CBS 342.82 TaxID=1314786 RepID=A0A6J3MG03_9PEZI|nr:protease [Dissoconium aciculare CBS 342.82]KAF1826793.1 protease [Dissoconium aciculare CBS 342.82]
MANQDRYGRYANIPIPSYDEAISSRPGSSTQHARGPGEISDDAERQGLLGEDGPANTHYRPPTVESPRSSEDSDLRLPEVGGGADAARRDIEELDYLDPMDNSRRSPRPYSHTRLRNISSRFSKFSATLSSIRLPSFRRLYTPYRMSAPTAARLCGLAALIILFYVLFAMEVFTGGRHGNGRFDPESVRAFVQENVDSERIAEYLTHISSYDHVAGTEGDLYMAEWMHERWKLEGRFDDVALASYYVLLNYAKPDGRSVSITEPEDKRWTAVLEEDMVNVDRQQTLAWHGHSKSDEKEGPLVYANTGSKEDFEYLRGSGIVLNGTIALIRNAGAFENTALKVKTAEEAGCIGALLYSDPSDDGSVKGAVWPDGPWRTADSVQRGSVGLTDWVMGDPLTPGVASVPDAKRTYKTILPGLVNIPSLPLAWRDAKVLIAALQGHGSVLPDNWTGGDETNQKWFSGTAATSADTSFPVVHIKNINDENPKQQIWNLHGVHRGVESPDNKVIVGSHRDAWCFGAVDPGSGSAVMMELVAIFGQLRKVGWRPLRTLEFASWDAAEFSLMGSTEYVEDNLDGLRGNGVAYLNVDAGVYSPDALFRASGSPVWQRPLAHALGRVSDPGSGKSLREVWETRNSEVESPGTEGDYAPFQSMAGVSSIDFGFRGADDAFPRNSCYDTFEWMNKIGDPGFNYHRSLAQIWALMILEVVDQPLLPFDLRNYAAAIQKSYISSITAHAAFQRQHFNLTENASTVDFTPLQNAADAFVTRADEFHNFEDYWTRNIYAVGGIENRAFGMQRLQFNDALSNFESDLLDLPQNYHDGGREYGVPGRNQFKHILFGPQDSRRKGENVVVFPLIRDALDKGDWKAAQDMVQRTADILSRATGNLPHII